MYGIQNQVARALENERRTAAARPEHWQRRELKLTQRRPGRRRRAK
jgi:hypothetical protein